MHRTIILGGRECRLETSAALPRIYRQAFKSDIFIDMDNIYKHVGQNGAMRAEDTDTIENVCWAMAKHADNTIPDIDEWLKGFEGVDNIYDAFKDIIELWNQENHSMSIIKKKAVK